MPVKQIGAQDQQFHTQSLLARTWSKSVTDDPQQMWNEYYQRIRRRRIREAQILHSQMANAGIECSTILALDFCHFSNDEGCIRNLERQLSGNYSIKITRNNRDENYWLLHGTTRPEGVDEMTEQRCVDWVSFMCDVAQSHGCVFSTWQLTDPLTARTWSNERIDVDPEIESK